MIKQAYFLSSFRTPQAYLPTYRAGSQISAESEEIHTYMPSRNLPSKDQTITRIPTRHNPVCICISSTHLPYLFISLSFRPRSLLPTSFAHYSPLIGCLIYTPSLSLPRSRITGSGPPLSRYQIRLSPNPLHPLRNLFSRPQNKRERERFLPILMSIITNYSLAPPPKFNVRDIRGVGVPPRPHMMAAAVSSGSGSGLLFGVRGSGVKVH
ncbi:hypothetical protein F5B18DRAFT_365706 [Nemania serpens]|nr:hypothetical protein F5B18DRAFT_365706 [Nemania serpens]